MTRRFLRAILTVALRIFFRRIEVTGAEQVPARGPVLFAVNHPNGLIDPLFLLCLAPRKVSFLAKEPLFRMPVVGAIVRAFDSIPVHRRSDEGADPAKNREAFAQARAALVRGQAIAIFPEGASHSEPGLRPLKSGVARIALDAASEVEPQRVSLVAVGLSYSAKARFRSRALLAFGPPLPVPVVSLGDEGEPSVPAVRELTSRLERAIAELTLQAESRESLELASRAERVFSYETPDLASQLELRRRFVRGASLLKSRDPDRFAALEQRVVRFDEERRAAGLSLSALQPGGLTTAAVFRLLAENLLALLLLPIGIPGMVLHYPAYRLAGAIAVRFARAEEDILSTLKICASLLLFPATWALAALAAGKLFGTKAAVAALVIAPLSGYAALVGREALDAVVGRARALLHLTLGSYATRRLLGARQRIREEILAVAEELEVE